jgi:hypothetical protein
METALTHVAEVQPLTVETAYGRLQERKDERLQQTEKRPEKRPEKPVEGWSDAEVAFVTAFQSEAQALGRDLQVYAQAKAANPDHPRLPEAEAELRARWNGVVKASGDLVTLQQMKALQGEDALLEEKRPGIDRERIRARAKALYGFTDDELATVGDHRLLLMADDAISYREGKAESKIIPRVKKPVEPDVIGEINRHGVTRENATRLMRTVPKRKRQPTAAELKAKLKKTGAADDAMALMRARRNA